MVVQVVPGANIVAQALRAAHRAQTAATVVLFSCQDVSAARSVYASATPLFH